MKEIEVKQEVKKCFLLLALLLILVATQTAFAQQNFTVTSTAEWNTALNTIRNGGNNQAYTITVSGNISVPGNNDNNNSFGSVQNVEVMLKGSGTLSLSSNGSILNVGSNQTLIIDDANLTMQGRDNNNRAVLTCSEGTLELKNGIISGNTNTSSSGCGGVNVVSGVFIMSGGAISGNTRNGSGSGGSGVSVSYGGTFTMTEGVISGNIGIGNYSCAVILFGATFTMTGGAISNNTTTGAFCSDGVYISSTIADDVRHNGTFIMSGGKIVATTGSAIYNASGTATVSGSATVTSTNTNSSDGTIFIAATSEEIIGNISLSINGSTVTNSAGGNAIYTNVLSTIALGNSPKITGAIRVLPKVISMVGNGEENAFIGENQTYTLDFPAYAENMVAVIGGAAFINKFTLAKAEWRLAAGTGSNAGNLVVVSPEREFELDFDTYSPIFWNNTFMLNLRKLREDGYEVTGCRWFKNGVEERDTRTIDEYSYSAGPNKGDLLDTAPTYYTFQIMTRNYDSLSSTKKFITTRSIAPVSIANEQPLFAYPNPLLSGSSLTLEGITKDSQIRIYNSSGLLVKSAVATGSRATLTLQLPSGVYLIRVGSKEVKIIVN